MEMSANRKVVVIEDDRDILDLIQYILADEGYQVAGYRRLEPLETIIEQQPSVILLDNRLEDGFGYTLCASLKLNKETMHIPVIMVSASESLEQISNNCNADAFLPKPFDLVDLVKLVKHYSEISASSLID
jgi:DNA-binding response OmpR family regulator